MRHCSKKVNLPTADGSELRPGRTVKIWILAERECVMREVNRRVEARKSRTTKRQESRAINEITATAR
jgi:hypothetical protein